MSGCPRADIKFFGKDFLYFNHFLKVLLKFTVEHTDTLVKKKKKKKKLCGFPWVETSTGPGGFMICMRIMTGSTKSGSGEASAVISFFEALVGAYNCVCLCAL